VLQEALKSVHRHYVDIHAAGRTDSGVHASGQVANFFSDAQSIPPDKFAPAINKNLPPDVRILQSEEVHTNFHARYDARSRTYKYYIYPAPVYMPFIRKYCHVTPRYPDIAALNRMASYLVGSHDFTTFTAVGDKNKNRKRIMYSAGFYPERDYIVFTITGTAFLWRMVRSIVGTFLEFEKKGIDPESVKEILAARDRTYAGETAPACGLYLHKITYGTL
jgi:tRNA pseudouridine38-40 synthase